MFLIGITLAPAIIAPGGSLSAPVALGALTLCGISMPAAWTAATLSYQASPDGGTTWQELFDDAGNAISTQAAAGQMILTLKIPEYCLRGINLLKVRSGSSGTPVVQSGGATINLLTRNEQI
jgi:hypothetical protein